MLADVEREGVAVETAPQDSDWARYLRVCLRVAIALLVTAGLGVAWWFHLPSHLVSTSNIVGYPAFFNYNYSRPIYMYRFAAYGVPILSIIVYLLLAWRGPLRETKRSRRRTGSTELLDRIDVAETAGSPRHGAVATVVSLLIPALVVMLTASARSKDAGQRINTAGVVCAVVYVLIVLGCATLLAGIRSAGKPSGEELRRALSLSNGTLGCWAALVGLWFAARHTVISVTSDRQAHWVHWLPLWLPLFAGVAGTTWAIQRTRAGRSVFDVERRLLSVVVGSVLVFLVRTLLPGSLPLFQGFDDAQNLAGAALLSRGYFPWRDLIFIHGPFYDVFRGSISLALFGDSHWGGYSGDNVLFEPLCWVFEYLFVVWLARRNTWLPAAFLILLASGLFDPIDIRFIVLPLLLILLGETLRRRSTLWCVLLAFGLVAQAILVPETALFAAPVLVTVAFADFVHRPPRTFGYAAYRRTVVCLLASVGFLAAFFVYLAANRALAPFFQYYEVFGPGHAPSGTTPLGGLPYRYYIEFCLSTAVVMFTIWGLAYNLRQRRDWDSRHWVALAAAGFAITYNEKAVRFDTGHIGTEVFAVALPLVMLWISFVATAVESSFRRQLAQTAALRRFGYPLTAVACVVLLLQFPDSVRAIDKVPGHLHALASSEPTFSRIGYAQPGAVDSALLDDLSTVFDTYAGPKGDVFDMSNSPGYIYYLLQRNPGTRFYHVSMAVPELAQNLLINELKRSRPAVVVFNSTATGLPAWDGLTNDIRHYRVSQYILDGWTPVLNTHGEMIMLRNDLYAHRPPVPKLTVPPLTADLWFNGPACDWGYVPNFLRSRASSPTLTVPLSQPRRTRILSVQGWAADPRTKMPASQVIVTSNGRQLDSQIQGQVSRPDVAAAVAKTAELSGFSLRALPVGNGPVSVFEVGSDGLLHQLHSARAYSVASGSITMTDGKVMRIGSLGLGWLDATQTANELVSDVQLPPGVVMSDFELVTLSGGQSFAKSRVELTDSLLSPDHLMALRTLPLAGKSVAVRVGSCAQWHGYSGDRLYVTQSGGSSIDTITLSKVR